MKTLYSEISPFNTFFLETHTQHQVYVEESGNPDGIPVLFLHGGPCSGTKPHHRQFFNPEKYRIVLMDQRGSGQSLPYGEIEHNTTQELIDDIEALRLKLDIDKWMLFAGSWGATLALLYAQKFPNCVSQMILRGVFLARQKDLDWFLNEGAGRIYPEKWQELVNVLPNDIQISLIDDLYNALWSDDELLQRRVAKAWDVWGAQVALGKYYDATIEHEHVSETVLQRVRMELHYAKNAYFIKENQILNNCTTIQHIPTTIIHGRYDLVCPVEAAMSLYQTLPHAEYQILFNAGHIAAGEEMIHALISATDKYAGIK